MKTNISISLPSALLEEIDKKASELGLTRSAYIRRAVNWINDHFQDDVKMIQADVQHIRARWKLEG